MNSCGAGRLVWLGLFLLMAGLCAPAWGEGRVHVVERGDTLGSIARDYETSTRALREYNHITDPDRVSIGQRIRIPPGPDVPVSHTVGRGETLSGIASTYGVTTRTLVEFNQMAHPDRLSVGQVILIPRQASNRRVATLPPAMRSRLDGIRVRRGAWQNIVLHHSGTVQGSAQNMDRFHREQRRMENGLAYHFVIGNGNGMGDGEIAVGPRWIRQIEGGHLASTAQNRVSIGICLVGNFDQTRPTALQMESLQALVRYLQRRCTIDRDRVLTHQQINVRPTACPGRLFPMSSFLESL